MWSQPTFSLDASQVLVSRSEAAPRRQVGTQQATQVLTARGGPTTKGSIRARLVTKQTNPQNAFSVTPPTVSREHRLSIKIYQSGSSCQPLIAVVGWLRRRLYGYIRGPLTESGTRRSGTTLPSRRG